MLSCLNCCWQSKLFNEQEVPSNSASEIETLYASIQLTKQVTLTNTSIPTTSTLISQLRGYLWNVVCASLVSQITICLCITSVWCSHIEWSQSRPLQSSCSDHKSRGSVAGGWCKQGAWIHSCAGWCCCIVRIRIRTLFGFTCLDVILLYTRTILALLRLALLLSDSLPLRPLSVRWRFDGGFSSSSSWFGFSSPSPLIIWDWELCIHFSIWLSMKQFLHSSKTKSEFIVPLSAIALSFSNNWPCDADFIDASRAWKLIMQVWIQKDVSLPSQSQGREKGTWKELLMWRHQITILVETLVN